jgi:hypothetical protein
VRRTARTACGAALLACLNLGAGLDGSGAAVRAAAPDSAPPAAAQRATQSSTERRSVRVPRGGTLDLRNIGGSVSVRPGTGRTAELVLTHSARASTAARARAALEGPRVRITERGDRVEVEPILSRTSGTSVVTTMSVEVPADTSVTIATVSGIVNVDGVRGDVTIETATGSITVRNADGLASAHTLTGSIDIADVESEQGIDVNSISGGVSLARVQARQLTITSVSAAVTATDISAARVETTSMSGSLTFSGTLQRSGRYEFHSHNGQIDLRLGGAGFNLDARTVHGTVQSPGLSLTAERRTRTTLRGTVGDGAATVEATTFSGQLTIRGK